MIFNKLKHFLLKSKGTKVAIVSSYFAKTIATFCYLQYERANISTMHERITTFYFATKGKSLHLFVYDSNKKRTLSKSVKVLFGKGKLKNTPVDFDNHTRQFPKKLKDAEQDNKTLRHWEGVINGLLDSANFYSAESVLQYLEKEHNSPIMAQHSTSLLEYARTIYKENLRKNFPLFYFRTC